VEWKTAVSVLKPEHRDQLRFEQRGGLLRNVLTLEVPSLAAEAVAEILDQALTQASVSRGEIRGWMMHAGGRDVLNALRLKLGLSQEELRWSSEVLHEGSKVSRQKSSAFACEITAKSTLNNRINGFAAFEWNLGKPCEIEDSGILSLPPLQYPVLSC
jgi:hypothetical protein